MDVRPIVRVLFNQAHRLCKVAEEFDSPCDDPLDREIRLKREAKKLRSLIKNPTAKAVKVWIEGGDSVTEGHPRPDDLTNRTEVLKYLAAVLSEIGMTVNFGWLNRTMDTYAMGGSYGVLMRCIEEFATRAEDPNFDRDKVCIRYINAVIKNSLGNFKGSSDGPKCRVCGSPSKPDVKHGETWTYVCERGHKFVER